MLPDKSALIFQGFKTGIGHMKEKGNYEVLTHMTFVLVPIDCQNPKVLTSNDLDSIPDSVEKFEVPC